MAEGESRAQARFSSTGVPAGAPVVAKIVSGGQTGVDRAALDVALALGIPCGGWVPKGRRAEDGPIPDRYPMRESASRAYARRTRRNVRDADATLILTRGAPTGGTALTVTFAAELGQPCRVADLTEGPEPPAVRAWLVEHRVEILNIAGPRESGCPGIRHQAVEFLQRLFCTT